MTRNKDFKLLVRNRMNRTGETYTAARAAMAAAEPEPAAQREQVQIVERWFSVGRLRAIPARRKTRTAVLLEVLTRFVPGQEYPESEVSAILAEVHPDFAYLRRELVAAGYLERQDAIYRMCRTPPIRTEVQRRELPAWEREWLPRYLAEAAR